ncbi:MAG: methyltransferase domain-containing protein [Bacteroidetes bacterium]|nr:methyltransferase domain-containing protein [Bacteroidota bacterium]
MMAQHKIADPLGQALLDHYNSGTAKRIQVLSPDVDDDVYSTQSFFTPFNGMPEVEQQAMAIARGKVLDVGAAAGRHSILLQDRLEVHALEQSPGAVEVMKRRGIKNTHCQDLWLHYGNYDTILLLMNGIGLAGYRKNVPKLLNHFAAMLNEGGQILFDSTDVKYLYADAESLLHLTEIKDYYGEVLFEFKYKGQKSGQFPWVYVDQRTMLETVHKAELKMEIVASAGRHGQYLGRITLT